MDTAEEFVKHLQEVINNPKALNYKFAGSWKEISTKEFVQEILHIAAGLNAIGVKKGDRVALFSPPSPLWTICDLAIMLIGGVSVPVYSSISEDHFLYQISQTECKVIFISGQKAHEISQRHASLFNYVIALDQWTQLSSAVPYKELFSDQEIMDSASLDRYRNHAEDLASIVYTSGTSDDPKGVELTHRNIFCQVFNAVERLQIGAEDRYLHFLPLAHIFGRLLNLSIISSNASIYYIEDVSKILEDCRTVKPTLMVLLPRMLEKQLFSIYSKIQREGWMKKWLALWALRCAKRDKQSCSDSFLYPLFEQILYKKVRQIYGGCLKCIMSGSAKANPKTQYFFRNIGLPIVDGYGLTEASPAITNSIQDVRIGYIGKPMPGVEVKISEHGEILLRGPVTMRGYYKNPELTKERIDADGWLHTADLGDLSPDGYVKFGGRLNEVCKTSYGETVNPLLLEDKLNQFPIVDYSFVIAEDRPYVTCLLFLDKSALDILKKRFSLSKLSDEEILNVDFVRKDFEYSFKDLNEHLDKGTQIRDYRFVFANPSIESGELTPSMKLRRRFVEEKYKDLISDMYPLKKVAIEF